MSLSTVKEYFKQYGLEDRIIVLKESSATVALAAQALQTKEERIAKTLSFIVNDQINLIVMAGDAKVDNKKYKQYFHKKAKMVPPQELEEKIGHSAGGVCPFGIKSNIDVYLDESLKQFDTVYPACGSANSAIELSINELETYSHMKEWIDISKKTEDIK